VRNRWTRENIIRQIVERRTAGLPLTVGENGAGALLYGAARRAFGSWRNALQAAGIAPAEILTSQRWSPAKILVMIRHFARRDRPLTAKEMEQRYHNVVTAARRHFGSWNKAVVAAGVDPDKLQRVVPWTPQRILESILTRALRNESLAIREVRPRSLTAAGHRFFGGWSEALVAAGLDPALVSGVGHGRKPTPTVSSKRQWDRDRVLAALRERLEANKPMNSAALAREDASLYTAMRRHLGSWREGLRAIGQDPAIHRARPNSGTSSGRSDQLSGCSPVTEPSGS
jgi:hypothetical protein